MARLPRQAIAAYPHHVIQRGHNRQPVFVDDDDRRQYLAWLLDASVEHGLAVHAYVLMDNHVHLLATPERDDALFVRVVSIGDDGVARALNHFNKKGKGAFVRALLESGELPETVEGVMARATQLGWPLRPGAPGELELVVPSTLDGFAGR